MSATGPTPRPVRRLPDALVNKIAAGEVVERPASVAKELLENSLDAGAQRIVITTEGAGRQLVAVVDDGHGIAAVDCLLALERHATSKVATEEELGRVSTLGFRGEALAAIFAVSRLRLLSRQAAAARGFLVIGEAGTVGEAGDAAAPQGTAIEVRDLFFCTPARAKFLKSPPTEHGAILRVVTQLVLAHPEAHVTYSANGRVVLNAPRAESTRQRLGSLYGYGLADRLLDVAGERGGACLAGLVAPPTVARTHREDLHVIVNGRAVRDTLLAQAVLDAYRPLLPRDRFPLAVLLLTVDPGEVDINVHPTKAWVRFRQPRVLHDLVHDGVAQALRQLDVIAPRALVPGTAWPGLVSEAPAPEAGGTSARPDPEQTSLLHDGGAPYGAASLFGQVVGQIEDTFIVAHSPEEVFFIDQHVAHERVLFERLWSDVAAGVLSSQALLFPEPLELAPARRRAVERALGDLGRLGFVIEAVGDGTLLLRGVPALLRSDEPGRLVDDLAREMDEVGGRAGSTVLDRLLAFVACRAAIKAHQPLGREEMARILTDLAATQSPFHCPHGRPIVSRLPLREIKRDLRRDW